MSVAGPPLSTFALHKAGRLDCPRDHSCTAVAISVAVTRGRRTMTSRLLVRRRERLEIWRITLAQKPLLRAHAGRAPLYLPANRTDPFVEQAVCRDCFARQHARFDAPPTRSDLIIFGS
jgi:hypothetical protein